MTEDKKPIFLTVEPVDFKPVADIKIISSTELASYINDTFNDVFADYEGCNINITFNEKLRCFSVVPAIFFKVLPRYDKNSLYGFKTVKAANATESDISNKIRRCYRRNSLSDSNSNVEITSEAKELLKPFMLSTDNSNNIKWDASYRITSNNTGLFVEVFNIDMIKILKAIFGKKDKNTGDRYEYEIYPLGIVQSPYRKADEWAIRITRNYVDTKNEVQKMLGYSNIQYGVNIITSTNR